MIDGGAAFPMQHLRAYSGLGAQIARGFAAQGADLAQNRKTGGFGRGASCNGCEMHSAIFLYLYHAVYRPNHLSYELFLLCSGENIPQDLLLK